VDDGVGHLDPAWSLAVGRGRTEYLDGRLLGRHLSVGRQHYLSEPGAVTHHEKGHPCQGAAPVHPSLQSDRGAGVGCGECSAQESGGWGQGSGQDHHLQVGVAALEVWAGAKSRCHHTFAGGSRPLVGNAVRARKAIPTIEPT